jgi:large conductance mechanosensitive channel
MKKFFEDFKKFITRGNVVDLAVGIIIGGAFTAIVKSLVADILMPIIGLFGFGSVKELKYVFTPAVLDGNGTVVTAEHALYYGNFIQAIIDFLLIAFVIFVIIKILMAASEKAEALKKKHEKEVEVAPAPAPAPAPSPEIVLLTEIRDALVKKE